MFEKQETNSGVSLKDYKQMVDFTILSPLFTSRDIERAANVAYKNRYRSLCVLPARVEDAKSYITERFSDALKLGTVIGFPLGASLLSTKVDEAKRALNGGADYIDCVIDLSNVKLEDHASVKREVSRLVRVARKKEINIIIETSALNREEISRLCKICNKCKVNNVMTSTGYGAGGATPEIVEVLKGCLNKSCGIKASGGVTSREEAVNLLRAGANLVATSREV